MTHLHFLSEQRLLQETAAKQARCVSSLRLQPRSVRQPATCTCAGTQATPDSAEAAVQACTDPHLEEQVSTPSRPMVPIFCPLPLTQCVQNTGAETRHLHAQLGAAVHVAESLGSRLALAQSEVAEARQRASELQAKLELAHNRLQQQDAAHAKALQQAAAAHAELEVFAHELQQAQAQAAHAVAERAMAAQQLAGCQQAADELRRAVLRLQSSHAASRAATHAQLESAEHQLASRRTAEQVRPWALPAARCFQ